MSYIKRKFPTVYALGDIIVCLATYNLLTRISSRSAKTAAQLSTDKPQAAEATGGESSGQESTPRRVATPYVGQSYWYTVSSSHEITRH